MNINELIKKHIKNVVNENKPENYMFFGNIQQMKRQCELLMEEDHQEIDGILKEHDWAQDHIAEAKSLLDQVFDFLMNETKGGESDYKEKNLKANPDFFNLNEDKMEQIDEGKNKPTNPKLWSRAKSMAKAKFKVYPSAYANGWAAKWYKKHGGGWRKSKK